MAKSKLLPISKVKTPKDLRRAQNGALSADLLRPIKPSGRIHHQAAIGWGVLQDLAAAEKLTGVFTIGETARNPEEAILRQLE